MKCAVPNCQNVPWDTSRYCASHVNNTEGRNPVPEVVTSTTMSQKYPKYYKDVTNKTEVDVYAIHHLFDIQDPSGAIQHASKKLLLSGVRTGGKSKFQDIKEARDTLNRWLEINPET